MPEPYLTASVDDLDASDMAQLAGGEEPALDRLMSRHAERLYHHLLRLLQNETEAADLAQEAFVRVYLNRAEFKAGHKFSTWLFTIASNLGRDVLRQRARHPHVSLEAPSDGSGHDFREALPEAGADPRELLEAAERAGAVRAAIAELTHELREALLLSFYEEKSHVEIARIVGCSPKAVEMRIYRARQQLRAALEGKVTSNQ